MQDSEAVGKLADSARVAQSVGLWVTGSGNCSGGGGAGGNVPRGTIFDARAGRVQNVDRLVGQMAVFERWAPGSPDLSNGPSGPNPAHGVPRGTSCRQPPSPSPEASIWRVARLHLYGNQGEADVKK